MDLKCTFQRQIQVESCGTELDIHQCGVGDVGCVVWDAGISLAKFLDYRKTKSEDFLRDLTVLELGAGTGIVGLVAAACGANAILTDLPANVPLLELNIAENSSRLKGKARSAALIWGETILETFSKPDVLLISDCVYYNESIKPLVQAMVDLSSTKTQIYVAYEDREIGNKMEMQNVFIKMCEEYFNVHKLSQVEFHPSYYSPDIHILKMNKI